MSEPPTPPPSEEPAPKPFGSIVGKVGCFLSLCGFITCGMSSFLALVVCSIALLRSPRDLWAGCGLALSLVFASVAVAYLPFDSPLWLGKYRYRLCVGGKWLNAIDGEVRHITSMRSPVTGWLGVVHLTARDGHRFDIDQLLAEAKKSDWFVDRTLCLSQAEVSQCLDADGLLRDDWRQGIDDPQTVDRLSDGLGALVHDRSRPLWIRQGVTIHLLKQAGETDLILCSTRIVLSDDNAEVIVGVFMLR